MDKINTDNDSVVNDPRSRFELSFGTLIKLSESVAEVIINEGVELSLHNVDEYHQWIQNNYPENCFVLINRVNAYTYTFEAQQIIGTIPQIKAISIVAYNDFSKLISQNLLQSPRESEWHSKVFEDRDSALEWLYKQQ